jgi:hypothetical protein
MVAPVGRTPILTGGCQCGAVRYALYAQPENVSVCHCRMCQKAVGQPFAVYALVARSDFAWTRGTPATFESSSVAARDFCAACGTPLTFRYFVKPYIDVSTGSLDRPSDAPPVIQYGIESRLGWLDTLEALPREETLHPNAPDYVRALISRQHPDREMEAG